LQARVLETADDPALAALHRVLQRFAEQLLAPGSDGRVPFVGRLLHLIKVKQSYAEYSRLQRNAAIP